MTDTLFVRCGACVRARLGSALLRITKGDYHFTFYGGHVTQHANAIFSWQLAAVPLRFTSAMAR